MRVGAEGGEEDSWGGKTANQKNNRGEGAMAWFRPGEKTRFWVFVVALNFSLKIVLCLFSPFQCI